MGVVLDFTISPLNQPEASITYQTVIPSRKKTQNANQVQEIKGNLQRLLAILNETDFLFSSKLMNSKIRTVPVSRQPMMQFT